jgi:hypothetical protein
VSPILAVRTFNIVTAKDLITYVPFVMGSLLLIVVGGVLLVAPAKFIAAGQWWGRKIGFPPATYELKTASSVGWRNWRLPGLYALCFGLFLLVVIVRSFLRLHPL